MNKYIKCRFCNWQTPAWITTKKGKRKSGYPRLQRHVYIEHPKEFKKIQEDIMIEILWQAIK